MKYLSASLDDYVLHSEYARDILRMMAGNGGSFLTVKGSMNHETLDELLALGAVTKDKNTSSKTAQYHLSQQGWELFA